MLYKEYKYGKGIREGKRIVFPVNQITLSNWEVVLIFQCFLNGNTGLKMDSTNLCGLGGILICAILAVILIQLSLHIFVRTWRYRSKNTYSDIHQDAFGRTGWTARIPVIIFYFYVTSAYFSNIVQYTNQLTSVWFPTVSLLKNKYFVCYIISLVLVLPFQFIKEEYHLRWVCHVCNVFQWLSCIPPIYFCIKQNADYGFDPQNQMTYFSNNVVDYIDCFNNWVFLFAIHPVFCKYCCYLKNPTQNEVIKITWFSTVACGLLNLALSLCTYFTFFGHSGGGNALFLYDQKHPLTVIGEIGGLLNTILTLALYCFLVSREVIGFFLSEGDDDKNIPAHIGSFLMALTGSVMLAFVNDVLLNVVTVIGIFCMSFLAFVQPSIFFFRMSGFKTLYGYITFGMVILSLFLTAVFAWRSITLYFP